MFHPWEGDQPFHNNKLLRPLGTDHLVRDVSVHVLLVLVDVAGETGQDFFDALFFARRGRDDGDDVENHVFLLFVQSLFFVSLFLTL